MVRHKQPPTSIDIFQPFEGLHLSKHVQDAMKDWSADYNTLIRLNRSIGRRVHGRAGLSETTES